MSSGSPASKDHRAAPSLPHKQALQTLCLGQTARILIYYVSPKHLGFPLDLPPIESEIVDAVSQSEKFIRGEPVESCKFRYFNSFELFDHTPSHLEPKQLQRRCVRGHSVISEVATHHRLQPLALFGNPNATYSHQTSLGEPVYK